MPSHLKEKPNKKRPAFVQDFHVAANDAADALANLGAKDNQVGTFVADAFIKQVKLVKSIQLRLAHITLALPSRDKASIPPIVVAPKPSIDELIVSSYHNLIVDFNESLSCTNCLSKCAYHDSENTRNFILSPLLLAGSHPTHPIL